MIHWSWAIDWVSATWHGLGPETKAAVIGAGSTIIAAAVGVFAIARQLKHQGRLNRENVAETERRRIKAELHQEAQTVCQEVSDAVIDFGGTMLQTGQAIEMAARCGEQGLAFPPPNQRVPELMRLHGTLHGAAIKFIFLIEQRRFVDPRITIFKTAVNVVLHDVREGFHTLFPLAVRGLPVEADDGKILSYRPLPAPESVVFKEMSDFLFERSNDLGSYVDDFMVEMQNLLLGDLFDTQVTHRVPLDPNQKVIRLADAEHLEQFFAKETDWGRKRAEVDAQTRHRFHPNDGSGANH